MATYVEQLTQALAVADYILPSNATTASFNSSTPIDASKYERILYVISVGAIGGSATLDARLQTSSTNFGTASNVANTNITQITAANTIVSIEIRADQIGGLSGGAQRWVRLNTTVGTAALNYSAVGFGGVPSQQPVANGTIVGQSLVCSL